MSAVSFTSVQSCNVQSCGFVSQCPVLQYPVLRFQCSLCNQGEVKAELTDTGQTGSIEAPAFVTHALLTVKQRRTPITTSVRRRTCYNETTTSHRDYHASQACFSSRDTDRPQRFITFAHSVLSKSCWEMETMQDRQTCTQINGLFSTTTWVSRHQKC